MPYTVIKSFERGLDTRRMIDTTEMGGLLDAKDCHITRGGELEKRAAFDVIFALPSTTVGFYAQFDDVYHTWGDAADPPVGLPSNVHYHSIPDPGGSPLTHILAVEEFQGKLYVVAEYTATDGTISIIHWFDDEMIANKAGTGGEIPDEGDGSDSGTVDPPPTPQSGAKASVTFEFEIDPSQLPHGTTISAITLTTPTGSATLSIVDASTAPFATSSSHVETVCLVIQRHINDFTTTPGVSAQASGGSVTIWMNDEGAQYNGWTVTITMSGWCNSLNGLTQTMTGGLTRTGGGAVAKMFDAPLPGVLDDPAVGDPRRLGTNVIAHEEKMYACNGSLLNISGFESATNWDPPFEGAGNIDFTMIAEGTPVILAMADFLGDLAIFCLRHVMVWSMDVDVEKNFKKQILHRTGLIAMHALVPYAESDVMYLNRSGIRSLRTRASVDQPFAADLGTRIDDLVRAKIAASTPDEKQYQFWAEVEPRSGRLWMALKDVIYVLSYFPDNQIAAWTYYDATEAPVDYMNASENNLYWRSGDNVICYAGTAGTTYDDTEGVARVPYADTGKMATQKNWMGIDAAAYGTWQIRASFDPTQPTAFDLVANITKSTYVQQKIAMNGESPSVSLEFRSSFVGPAKIGNATVHYTEGTAD